MAKKKEDGEKDHNEAGAEKTTLTTTEVRKTTKDVTHDKGSHGASSSGWSNPWTILALGAVVGGMFVLFYIFGGLPNSNPQQLDSSAPGSQQAEVFPANCRGSFPSIKLTQAPVLGPRNCKFDYGVNEGTVRFVDPTGRTLDAPAGSEPNFPEGFHAVKVVARTITADMWIRFH